MLIEFKISNFRSIREEQTLSLVASNADKELPESVHSTVLPGLSGVKLLKGAAIYGANASGKSNVLQALEFLANFVRNSAIRTEPGSGTNVQPFKLDKHSLEQPSKFEVTMVIQNCRYLFGVSMIRERVLEEYLVAYPKGAPQRWYHRTYNADTDSYDWAAPSSSFRHDKSLEDKTRKDALFLSVAPLFNHTQLTWVYHWFTNKLSFLKLNHFNHSRTITILERELQRDLILTLLKHADIGIKDLKIQEARLDPEAPLGKSGLLRIDENGGQQITIELKHQYEGIDSIGLDYETEESAGTRHYFSLLGPWAELLESGSDRTVFIDEIETSLHPVLIKELLKLAFSNSNDSGQVVFTTHNPVLLDPAIMRRDQIWFTEKSQSGTTSLYPLSDFQPRKNESLTKGYLVGRYGAIPFIPAGLIP